MSVPTIALYATPPEIVCSSTHHSSEYDLNPNPTLVLSSSSPPSSCQKPIANSLSYVLSGHSSDANEVSSPWHDRSDNLSRSFLYPTFFKPRDLSGFGLFVKLTIENLYGLGKDWVFSKFMRNPLCSCLDYDPLSLHVEEGLEELTFDLDEGLQWEKDCDPYTRYSISKV